MSVAGVHEALVGGKDCALAERAVASGMVEAGGPDLGRAAWAGRQFARRAVAFLATGRIHQFIDVGCGYPWAGLDVHEVAQQAERLARVVYVDRDPVVVRHRIALSRRVVEIDAGEFHEGAEVRPASMTIETTAAVEGDVRKPLDVLADPRVQKALDGGLPVGVLMCGVLEHLSDQDAARAVAGWRELLPLGSALVLSHISTSPVAGDKELVAGLERAARVHEECAGPYVPRSRAQLEELFAGWTLLRPGLTRADRWRAATLPAGGAHRLDGHHDSHGYSAIDALDVDPAQTAGDEAHVRALTVYGGVPALAGVAALGEPDLLGVPDSLGVHAWTKQRRNSSRAEGGAPWS